MLDELDRIPPRSLSEPWLGLVSWARAVAHLQLGDTTSAWAAADAALAYAGFLSAPFAQGTRLQALWYEGHLDEVCEGYRALVDRVAQAGYRNSAVLVAAQCCIVHTLQGQGDRAAAFLDQAEAAAALVPESPLVDTNLAIAEAALALASGDEATAASVLEAYVERYPIGEGLAVAAQRRHLALLYVLVPATRPAWEQAALGPAWVVARDLARAVTTVREGHRLPPGTRLPDDVAVVRAHLPPAWVADLAVAALAGQRPSLGWRLIEASWPAAQPGVADLAVQGPTAALRQAADVVLDRLPVPPTSPLELRLLGPIELRREGAPVDAPRWRHERARALLVYLALHRTVSRERIASDLWPGLDLRTASRHLRTSLANLLHALEPGREGRGPSFFIRQYGKNLSLHAGESLTVDVWDFDACCDAAVDADEQGRPAVALERALAAAELWRSEPVELLAEPWAFAEIERRRARLAEIATRAGELRLAQGLAGGARELAELARGLDPWLEATHRLLVAIHRSAGDEPAAQRSLRFYREAIHDFGLGLDDATLMVERLLDARPSSSSG